MTLHSKTRREAADAGFTLIEMLVVLAIIGLIVGLIGPRAIEYLGRARSTTARIQIETLSAAIDLMRLDIGRLPSQSEGLNALVERPPGLAAWRGPYIKGQTVPLDPWNRPYGFRIPGSNGRPFDLFSLGADGQPGGTGDNQDITN